jgi:hypothetical protein
VSGNSCKFRQELNFKAIPIGALEGYVVEVSNFQLRTVRKLFASSSMVNSNYFYCVTVQEVATGARRVPGLEAIVPLQKLNIQQTTDDSFLLAWKNESF